MVIINTISKQHKQTRRSIDRLCDKNTRSTPSFIIIGAQKAGTTSLYESIKLHPLFSTPKRRETHNLDWRWNLNLQTTTQHQQHALSFYHTKALNFRPSCLTGDSTPSYLVHPDLIIPRIQLVFPHEPKIIAILRNPTDRALSHYSMVTDPIATPQQRLTRGTQWIDKSFEQVIHDEFTSLKKIGLIPYWDIESQNVDMDVFNSFVGSKEEDDAYKLYQKSIPMNTGSHSLILRGMYELQLRHWMNQYSKEKILVLNMDDLSKYPSKVMSQVFTFIDLPDISNTFDDYPKANTRKYDCMVDDTRSVLDRFYELYNRRLENLLGGSWKDCWF